MRLLQPRHREFFGVSGSSSLNAQESNLGAGPPYWIFMVSLTQVFVSYFMHSSFSFRRVGPEWQIVLQILLSCKEHQPSDTAESQGNIGPVTPRLTLCSEIRWVVYSDAFRVIFGRSPDASRNAVRPHWAHSGNPTEEIAILNSARLNANLVMGST